MTTGTPASLAAVSARIPGRDFAMLEAQQDPADAYRAAVAYCEGAAAKANKTLDWADSVAGEALRFRFWFELYSAVEGESVAQDKATKADQYLAQLLGDESVAGIAQPAQAQVVYPAVGVVKQAPRPSVLDGFRTR